MGTEPEHMCAREPAGSGSGSEPEPTEPERLPVPVAGRWWQSLPVIGGRIGHRIGPGNIRLLTRT